MRDQSSASSVDRFPCGESPESTTHSSTRPPLVRTIARLERPDRYRLKAILSPSGDQTGLLSDPPPGPVRRGRDVPVTTSNNHIRRRPNLCSLRTTATRLPSGDRVKSPYSPAGTTGSPA